MSRKTTIPDRMLRWLATAGAALLMVAPVPAWAAGPCAYVTNQDSDTVSVLDTATNTVRANPVAGDAPDFVAVHPLGTRVYVSNTVRRTITVISTATNAILATIPSVSGALAVHPTGTRLYVADGVLSNVTVIDTATNTVLTLIPVGGNPSGVAVTPDGTRLYVANQFNATVAVINALTNTIITTIGVGGTPSGVAVHPAGTRVYVVSTTSNFVAVIDPAINTVISTVPVLGSPVGIAVNPAGTRIYVTNASLASLTVIDAGNNSQITTIPVGNTPQGVSVHPASTFVYVANSLSNTVSVIDANLNQVIRTVTVQLRPIALGQFVGPDLSLGAGLALSGAAFRPGQTLTLAAAAVNPAGGLAADLYVGAVLPDGQTTVFLNATGEVAALTTLATPLQFRAALPAPACFVFSDPAFFRFTFPATGLPAGTYHFFAVLARQGAFADNVIRPGDILASDVKTLIYTP